MLNFDWASDIPQETSLVEDSGILKIPGKNFIEYF